MNFILIAWILNITTGEPFGFDRIHSYGTPQECIAAMNEGRIEHVKEGKIRAYQCVRADQLGEANT